jgi:16S rRNA processing protein RimM
LADGGRDLIAIGTVVKPHGLLGEVAVEVLTDFPSRFTEGLSVTLRAPDGDIRPSRIASVRPHGGRLLVRFDGVEDVSAADELRGNDLCVDERDAAPRPPGFVYHYEVEGCIVYDASGNELGVVKELLDAGGRALLVLATRNGERDVPFTAPIVVDVDVAKKRIVLAPLPGLLD